MPPAVGPRHDKVALGVALKNSLLEPELVGVKEPWTVSPLPSVRLRRAQLSVLFPDGPRDHKADSGVAIENSLLKPQQAGSRKGGQVHSNLKSDS